MKKLITASILAVSLSGCAAYQDLVDEANLKAEQAAAYVNEVCGYDTRKFKREVKVGYTTEDCFQITIGYNYDKTVYTSSLGTVNSYWLDVELLQAKDGYYKKPTDAYKPRQVKFINGVATSVVFGE
jgi:hypothetical protein